MPLVRTMVNEVLAENDTAARDAYRRALTNPRTALDALKLAALLNREIGTGPKIELNPGESGAGRLKVKLTWPDEAPPRERAVLVLLGSGLEATTVAKLMSIRRDTLYQDPGWPGSTAALTGCLIKVGA